jgi:cytidylate kinase
MKGPTQFLHCHWQHDRLDEVTDYWIEIEDDRSVSREVQYRQGLVVGLASWSPRVEWGTAWFEGVPIPELDEIIAQPDLTAVAIDRIVFEEKWQEARAVMLTNPKFTIAIDGPAGAGKGTLARRLADHYRLNLLDTGLTYRAVAHALIQHALPLDNVSAAETAARQVDLNKLDRAVLSAHAVGEAASKVAVFPSVRRILVEKQRDFAKTPPGAVLDGRDIGTVVCPDADIKLYVTASAEVRARRRLAEIESIGGSANFTEILADIVRRDERDMGRADSPLKPAADAHLLDTSDMAIEAAFLAARAIIDHALATRGKA